VIRFLSLVWAGVLFAIGSYFAAIFIWLVVAVLSSQGQTILFAGIPFVLAGFAAVFFLMLGYASLKAARAGKGPKVGPEETFK
jgi:hypothetical protein